MNQGEIFKKELDKRGVNKTEAARKMGVARETLYKMFRSSRLHEATILKIKKTLGIDLATHSGTQNTTQSNSNDMKNQELTDQLLKTQRELIEAYREIDRLKEVIASKSGGDPKRGSIAG